MSNKKLFVTVFIILTVLQLCGCSNTMWLEDIVIPDNCVYNVDINSIEADDIDMNFIVGRGIEIGGTRSAYVIKEDNYSYYVEDGSIGMIDNNSIFFDEEYVGDYIVSEVYKIIGEYNSELAVRTMEVEMKGDKSYLFRFDTETDEYSDVEVFMYTDVDSMVLKWIVLRLDDLLEIVLTPLDLSEYVVTDYTYNIETKEVMRKLSDYFVKHNVYTYGKYLTINDIVDRYNGWLGGDI